MKKTVICVLLTLMMAILIGCGCSSGEPENSFRNKPAEEIREYILEFTPIGMSMDDARQAIEDYWQIDEWGRGTGQAFTNYYNGFRCSNSSTTIGVKSFQVELGRYPSFPWPAVIHANWGFDENSTLIDVYVEKIGFP